MTSTLKELGCEYEKSLAIQAEIIKKNRERLMQARRKANCKEIKRLNTLLRTLYEEKWELEEKVREINKYLN